MYLRGGVGKHPDIVKATAEAAKSEHLEAVKPFEAKLRKTVKDLDEVSKQVASLIDMTKKPEMKNLSSEFKEVKKHQSTQIHKIPLTFILMDAGIFLWRAKFALSIKEQGFLRDRLKYVDRC